MLFFDRTESSVIWGHVIQVPLESAILDHWVTPVCSVISDKAPDYHCCVPEGQMCNNHEDCCHLSHHTIHQELICTRMKDVYGVELDSDFKRCLLKDAECTFGATGDVCVNDADCCGYQQPNEVPMPDHLFLLIDLLQGMPVQQCLFGKCCRSEEQSCRSHSDCCTAYCNALRGVCSLFTLTDIQYMAM